MRNEPLKLYVRFLTLNPQQIERLKTLDVSVSSVLDPTVNAVFSDQFFIEQNIQQLPKLAYLQLATSNPDLVDINHPNFSETVISGARGVFNQPMSEYVLSHLLSIFQNHAFYRQTKQDQQWRPSRHGEALGAKKVAIIGLGQIGLHLAKTLSFFGCRIDGFNRTDKDSIYLQNVYPLSELGDKIGQYDIVILSISLNLQTKGIFNGALIAKLNSNAVVVNISRGQILDEQALIQALSEKKIRHAVLDTFQTEPLPKGHPFWTFENVTITPHISYTSPQNLNRMFECLYNNLSLYRSGERLINQFR